MSKVDLGFAEERENAALWLCNRYFPSKIGGKPAWLELETLPTKQQMCCSLCEQPLSFVCQIYAPGEDEHNFHRSLYLFICRQASCQRPNQASNLLVLRSQLPLKNDFYAAEPPNESGEPLPEIPAKQKLCQACGCPGPLACGRCRNANYCSAKHQRALWPSHKLKCGTANNTEAATTSAANLVEDILLPEFEIVMETEQECEKQDIESKDIVDQQQEQQRLKEFEQLAAQGKTGTFKDLPDEELEKYAQAADKVDDKYFRRFKKLISNEPEQILRYKRGGSPLWITDLGDTVAEQLANVPACELCGSEREFEFQIMPQLLLTLKDENLDWGVLAIYSCAKNCQIPKAIGYAKEYIVKQDIVDGKTI